MNQKILGALMVAISLALLALTFSAWAQNEMIGDLENRVAILESK